MNADIYLIHIPQVNFTESSLQMKIKQLVFIKQIMRTLSGKTQIKIYCLIKNTCKNYFCGIYWYYLRV